MQICWRNLIIIIKLNWKRRLSVGLCINEGQYAKPLSKPIHYWEFKLFVDVVGLFGADFLSRDITHSIRGHRVTYPFALEVSCSTVTWVSLWSHGRVAVTVGRLSLEPWYVRTIWLKTFDVFKEGSVLAYFSAKLSGTTRMGMERLLFACTDSVCRFIHFEFWSWTVSILRLHYQHDVTHRCFKRV